MTDSAAQGGGTGPGRLRTALLASLTLSLTAGFIALGWWQAERRAWKLDLIERVEARVDAPPVAPPGPAAWDGLTRDGAEYLRVTTTGRFLEGTALVQAVTEEGAGYWALQPLATDAGPTILVNRGFVPDRDTALPAPEGAQRITGLLRLTEPGGGFLRANAPEDDRWYSRDTAAIAADLGVTGAAPYFIDAEAGANGGPPAIGGLTIVSFRNSHLVYALTWFALALMCAGATGLTIRSFLRDRAG